MENTEKNLQNSSNQMIVSLNNIIYISNIPKKIQKEQLYELLLPFGPINSLNIIYRGDFAFAFAEYDDMRDAAAAVKDLNQITYRSRKLKVQFKNKRDNSCSNMKSALKEKNLGEEQNTKKSKQCETQAYLEMSKIEKSLHNQKNRRRSTDPSYSRERSREKTGKRHRDYERTKPENRELKQNKNPTKSKRKEKDQEIDPYQLEEMAQDLFHIEQKIIKLSQKLHRFLKVSRKRRN